MALKRLMAPVSFGLAATLFPLQANAHEIVTGATSTTVSNTGVSGLWILANISYAGMRAQNHPSVGWRILSFIFGFPGTLLSFFVIREGSGRAYGIHIPKRTD